MEGSQGRSQVSKILWIYWSRLMKKYLLLSLIMILAVSGAAIAQKLPTVSTFSIVAIDPQTGEMGVAVASRYFSVGSVVPWAMADVGAVATQIGRAHV